MTHQPLPATTVELTLEAEALQLVPAPAVSPWRTALGWSQVVQAFGQHMPTALRLENAIALVEDAVMPAARILPAGPIILRTASPLLHEVAQAAGADLHAQPARLSRTAVEHLFSRLADQAERGAYADPALPQRPDLAAALLILREALHHWGVEWLELED
jgi:hypothetical protein